MEAISKAIAVAPSDPNLPGTGCIQRGYQLLESKFDVDYGGFGSAPKFPQPGGCSSVSSYAKTFVPGCYWLQYRNLPKISPPSKIRPPPFLNEVVAKDSFLSKVRPPIYAAVHAVILSKKHQRRRRRRRRRSSTSTKANMHHCCYCVSKCMTKEALQNHCMHKYRGLD